MERLNRIILDLYGSASECGIAEFDSNAMTLLKPQLGFQSATVVAANFAPDESLKIQSLHIHNQPVEKLVERRYLTSKDTVLLNAFRNKGQCVISDASIENRDKPDLLRYCQKYEVAHTLVLIDEGVSRSHFDVVAFWRAQSKNAYLEGDARVGQLLIPHLFKARAINRRIHIGNSKIERMSLLADLHGCLQFLDEPTIQVLTGEWPGWEPPLLPARFMAALKQTERQYFGKTFVATCSAHDRYLFIQLTPKPRSQALTKAEATVAKYAARGLSYKEVARELGTSPATVRNQLHSAYAKLGVSNKTSLAAVMSPTVELLPHKP